MLLKKFFFNPYSFLIFLWFQISPFTQSLGQTTPLALPSDEPRVDLSSPYHSIRTHLDFLDTENYYPDSSARAFFYPVVVPIGPAKLQSNSSRSSMAADY